MDYIKQTKGKPVFEELVWNKPETKALAGKLLIIGGNMHAIIAPSTAYMLANKAGAGEVRVVLPDKTKKLLGPKVPPEIELVKSTPSGSFSKDALPEILSYTEWADAILFAGDLSHNSETAILLEQILNKTTKKLVITKDAADYFVNNPSSVLARADTTLVISFAQLQKTLTAAKYKTALTFDMQHNNLSEVLVDISKTYKCSFVTQRNKNIYCSVAGKLSITELDSPPESWRIENATNIAVWWMQNPNKPFEAISTAAAILQ